MFGNAFGVRACAASGVRHRIDGQAEAVDLVVDRQPIAC